MVRNTLDVTRFAELFRALRPRVASERAAISGRLDVTVNAFQGLKLQLIHFPLVNHAYIISVLYNEPFYPDRK